MYFYPMRLKKYIKLTPEEIKTLEEGYKNATHHQFRQRCHALLLSHQGKDMAKLSTIFSVTHATISNWFSGWDDKGIVGLQNQAGQGRKTILKPTDLAIIKEKTQANPQHLKLIREELKEELNRSFSEKTLKRFLKRLVRPLGDGGVNA